MEISKDVIRAYNRIRVNAEGDYEWSRKEDDIALVHFAKVTLARALKAEWYACYWERDHWTDEQWQAEADRLLRGEAQKERG